MSSLSSDFARRFVVVVLLISGFTLGAAASLRDAEQPAATSAPSTMGTSGELGSRQGRQPYLPHETTVYGPGGTMSCGYWLQARKAETDVMKTAALLGLTWTQGWISAAGAYAPSGITLRAVDRYAVEAYLDNYCADHPLDRLAFAARALVEDLAR